MMNDKEINDFAKSVIKEADLEMPSSDFVLNVMDKIKVEPLQSVEVVYKPLISKTGWVLIVSIIVLGLFYAVYGGSSTSVFSNLEMSYFNILNFNIELPDYKFSNIFTFSVVVLAAMVTIQIFGIKYFYSKKSLD